MKVLELIDFDLKLSLENQADLVIGVDEVGRGSLAGPVVCAAYSFNPASRVINYSENLIKLDDSKKIKNKDRILLVDTLKNTVPKSFYAIQENSAQYIDEHGIVKAIFTAMAKAVSQVIIDFRRQVDSAPVRVLVLVDGPKLIPELELYLKASEKNSEIGVPLDLSNGTVAERTSSRLRRTNDRSVLNVHEDHEDDENAEIGVPQQSLKVEQIAIKKGDSLSASIAAASNIAKDYRDRLMKELLIKDPSLEHYGWDTNVGYGSLKHRKAILGHGFSSYHRVSFCKVLSNIAAD